MFEGASLDVCVGNGACTWENQSGGCGAVGWCAVWVLRKCLRRGGTRAVAQIEQMKGLDSACLALSDVKIILCYDDIHNKGILPNGCVTGFPRRRMWTAWTVWQTCRARFPGSVLTSAPNPHARREELMKQLKRSSVECGIRGNGWGNDSLSMPKANLFVVVG
jgi:hypothetical protein